MLQGIGEGSGEKWEQARHAVRTTSYPKIWDPMQEMKGGEVTIFAGADDAREQVSSVVVRQNIMRPGGTTLRGMGSEENGGEVANTIIDRGRRARFHRREGEGQEKQRER